jgi:septum formation protein
MTHLPFTLVLASVSPRRQEILRKAAYRFTVFDPGDAEEQIGGDTPSALACARARAKAACAVRALRPTKPTLIIAADTLVALGSEVLGKPLDRNDARRILERLSGTRQEVISGLCLWPEPHGPEPLVEAVSSWVTMRSMTPDEIAAYVDSGEADGKAGAYAIQETGDRFVEKLEGSLLNVVGFPLERFEEQLHELSAQWPRGSGASD